MPRYIDIEGYRKLFDAEYKKTRELINQGETHLDNIAEGFSEASRVIDRIPLADVVPRIELDAMRSAANSYKMHYENARSEVVSEVLQMIKNICAYEERLSYQTIEEGIKRQIALKASRTKADRCVVCGEIVPEGRQICSMCETGQEFLKKRKGEEIGEQENVFKTIN